MDDTEHYFIQATMNLRAHGHGPNFYLDEFFSLGFFRLRWLKFWGVKLESGGGVL
jgi:hypothetical protein